MTLAFFWKQLLVLAVVSYFLGNINFALIFSKLILKKDIRKEGSGNPGTMNMMRNHGILMGLLTLFADALKAAVPAFVAKIVFDKLGADCEELLLGDIALYLSGLCVAVGHIFPIALKFKGGKGIACTLGVFFVAQPLIMSIVFVFAVIYFIFFEYGSVLSFICVISLIVERGIYYNNNAYFNQTGGNIVLTMLLFLIFFVTIFAHRSNIVLLILDKERKTPIQKMLNIKKRKIVKY